MTDRKRIVVAMSGGVDSSVAAALLHEAGHEVIGITLKLLDRGLENFGCCGSPEDIAIARRAAETIGVPHYVLDYSRAFKEGVIDYFFDSYAQGETPNPCLACNRTVKFDRLFEFTRSLEGDFLATGHYARIAAGAAGSFRLLRALDRAKDQSYVLFMMNPDKLRRSLFPLGALSKPETRRIAARFRLPNAEKPDSQDICFVPGKDYRAFLRREAEDRPEAPGMNPGPILDGEGRRLGTHGGIAFYTVGQREGLGLSTRKPLYVKRLDPSRNAVVVGESGEILSEDARVEDVRWVSGEAPPLPFRALAQIRYRHEPAPVEVRPGPESGLALRFQSPQRAVTPGQAAVLYRHPEDGDPDEVIGGGILRGPAR